MQPISIGCKGVKDKLKVHGQVCQVRHRRQEYGDIGEHMLPTHASLEIEGLGMLSIG